MVETVSSPKYIALPIYCDDNNFQIVSWLPVGKVCMLRRRYYSVVALGVAAMHLCSPVQASAVDFPPGELPGVVEYNGSWDVQNGNGTVFHIVGSVRAVQGGGDPVYWEAQTQSSSGTCWSPGNQYISGNCTNDFYDKGKIRGVDSNVSDWRTSEGTEPLDASARIHRVNLRGCVNLRFRPDNCSDYTLSPVTYEFG